MVNIIDCKVRTEFKALLHRYMALGKFFNLSAPSPFCKMGITDTYPTGMWWGITEVKLIKWVAHNKPGIL